MQILITGGSGFVGNAVLERLRLEKGFEVKATIRIPLQNPLEEVTYLQVGEIGPHNDWKATLTGLDVVVHTAARAHVMKEKSQDPLSEFRRVNVEGTLNLARQAAQSGCRRFVFVSSIGVCGRQTIVGKPYQADDFPAPEDAYAISKYEAEIGLKRIAEDTDMEVVIIRPPLVYGPRAKGNFLELLRWLDKGIPLPLGRIDNQRSYVALDNLVDVMVVSLRHPRAANQTFLVSDDEDLSTSDLLRQLGRALGKNPRLLPIPVWLLRTGLGLVGKGLTAQRLCGSLQVDITKTKTLLNWRPPISVTEGLKRAAEHFLAHRRS